MGHRIGDLDDPDSLSRVSSESARALKKYTTNNFQIVGLHNAIAQMFVCNVTRWKPGTAQYHLTTVYMDGIPRVDS